MTTPSQPRVKTLLSLCLSTPFLTRTALSPTLLLKTRGPISPSTPPTAQSHSSTRPQQRPRCPSLSLWRAQWSTIRQFQTTSGLARSRSPPTAASAQLPSPLTPWTRSHKHPVSCRRSPSLARPPPVTRHARSRVWRSTLRITFWLTKATAALPSRWLMRLMTLRPSILTKLRSRRRAAIAPHTQVVLASPRSASPRGCRQWRTTRGPSWIFLRTAS